MVCIKLRIQYIGRLHTCIVLYCGVDEEHLQSCGSLIFKGDEWRHYIEAVTLGANALNEAFGSGHMVVMVENEHGVIIQDLAKELEFIQCNWYPSNPRLPNPGTVQN